MTAECDLPALPEGTVTVRVNGEEAFDLPVREPDPAPGALRPDERCFTVAPEPPAGRSCAWPGMDLASQVSSLCHPEAGLASEWLTVEVTDPCPGCHDLDGYCEVMRTGTTLWVSPARRSCECPECGDCPGVCVEHQRTCRLPPLTEGTYTVRTTADDGPMTELRIGLPLTNDVVCDSRD